MPLQGPQTVGSLPRGSVMRPPDRVLPSFRPRYHVHKAGRVKAAVRAFTPSINALLPRSQPACCICSQSHSAEASGMVQPSLVQSDGGLVRIWHTLQRLPWKNSLRCCCCCWRGRACSCRALPCRMSWRRWQAPSLGRGAPRAAGSLRPLLPGRLGSEALLWLYNVL